MLRALMRSIFGRNAGSAFCSMMVQRTPRRPRSMASVRPVGPAPTIRMSLFIVCHLRSCCRSLTRRRQCRFKFFERLVGSVGTSLRLGIDNLRHLAGEINRHFVLDLIMSVELQAHDVALAIADRLERRLADERAAVVEA